MASLRHDLGVALMAAGQLKEAAAAFNAALGLDPRLPSAHFHIGQILENLGQLDKAIPAFEAAVALAPDVVAAQMRLGSSIWTAGCTPNQRPHSVRRRPQERAR